MSTNESMTRAALESQAFALMARLHVALRRGCGRVTDIEYMRIDPNYCLHILELVAASDNQDLRQIGVKLKEICFDADGFFASAETTPAETTLAKPAPAETTFAKPAPTVDRYIGRLR